MKTRKRSSSYIMTKNKGIVIMLLFCFLAGIIIGVVCINVMNEKDYITTSESTKVYLSGFSSSELKAGEIFRDSVFKYVKLVVVMWLLAFVPSGGFFTLIVIMTRGIGYGFSTALLVRLFGFDGLICAAILYLLQSIIIVPIYFFVAFSSIGFTLYNLKNAKQAENSSAYSLKMYGAVLLIGCGGAITAALIDSLVVPMLINRFL